MLNILTAEEQATGLIFKALFIFKILNSDAVVIEPDIAFRIFASSLMPYLQSTYFAAKYLALLWGAILIIQPDIFTNECSIDS